MEPLVVTQDPDLTYSEEEKDDTKAAPESVQTTNQDIFLSTTVTADASEPVTCSVPEKNTTELDSIQPQTIIEDISVAQTSPVDALRAKHIRPWKDRQPRSQYILQAPTVVCSKNLYR